MAPRLTNAETVLLDAIREIEGFIEQRKEINEEISNIYKQLKLQNFNPKIVRKIVALRAKDPELIHEEDQQEAEYRRAVGL